MKGKAYGRFRAGDECWILIRTGNNRKKFFKGRVFSTVNTLGDSIARAAITDDPQSNCGYSELFSREPDISYEVFPRNSASDKLVELLMEESLKSADRNAFEFHHIPVLRKEGP
jgi:hypothetical protein